MAELASAAAEAGEAYEEDKDGNVATVDDGVRQEARANVFTKGQSARIWEELYKVLDCSDIVIQVLDARNVPGTRSLHVERYLR